MSEATVRCPKCGHEGIVITELLNSDLALISDSQQAEIERLRVQLLENIEQLDKCRQAAIWLSTRVSAEELAWACDTWPWLGQEVDHDVDL